jgi:hypothetical protein
MFYMMSPGVILFGLRFMAETDRTGAMQTL